MAPPAGIFVLGELTGPTAEALHALTARYDPKLARFRRPHVTLAGSSGVGPISANTPEDELGRRLAPIAATTPPFTLLLEPPYRFPQTDIVVLPVSPYGAIRALHDRIATCGLHFGAARFTFTPHVTLNLYKSLTRETFRALMREASAARGSVVLERLQAYYTREPQPAELLLDLPLTGTAKV